MGSAYQEEFSAIWIIVGTLKGVGDTCWEIPEITRTLGEANLKVGAEKEMDQAYHGVDEHSSFLINCRHSGFTLLIDIRNRVRLIRCSINLQDISPLHIVQPSANVKLAGNQISKAYLRGGVPVQLPECRVNLIGTFMFAYPCTYRIAPASKRMLTDALQTKLSKYAHIQRSRPNAERIWYLHCSRNWHHVYCRFWYE